MLVSIFQRLRISPRSVRSFCSSVSKNEHEDIDVTTVGITQKKWDFEPVYVQPRQVWIENMDTVEEAKMGILELHPDVFASAPRVDIIHDNITWQKKYRWVSYAHTKTRAEVRGGGRKPWPQKGGGRARHGSIRSPLFSGGGIAHGPRAFTTHFYMLPYFKRVKGLTSTLSIKLAQDDLHIVNDINIPTAEKSFVENLIATRNWGPSVLIIDDTDYMPENIALACDEIKHVNLMPVYGLNVYSMLKHSTLVLTVAAAEKIEKKLLESLNLNTQQVVNRRYKIDQV